MAKRDSSRAKFSASVIQDLGAAVGHAFTNHALVREALTHSSVKTDEQPSNERLEFFGDAVLGLAVTEMIFHEFPEFPEGEMTRIKSSLVSRETLAKKALEYGFDKFIVLGKGLGARADLPRSILSNVYEAIIAALYIDGGYDVCVTFIRKCFQPDLRALVSQQASRNYKSALQQLTQSHMSATPTYTVLSESGPDHDKRFTVAAVIGKRKFAAAEGPSKKEAEQSAALLALKVLLEELDLGEKDSALLIELEDDEDDES